MIDIEPLRAEHFDGFNYDRPVGWIDIPQEQWGRAVAFVKDGEVLAICGGWERDGAVELGMLIAAKARDYPVTLHRMAKRLIEGLHIIGYERIRAWPDSIRSGKWLERLGFHYTNSGAYEKCQNQ